MPTITTPSGHLVIVDKDTAEWASKLKWNICPRGYARTWVRNADGTRKYVPMHRLVLRAKEGEIVDHKNRDKLDNRKKNLRVVSSFVNSLNRSSQGKSKYKGVAKHRSGWQVYAGGKYVGLFTDEVVAAKAYDAAAKKIYGTDAVTNKEIKLL